MMKEDTNEPNDGPNAEPNKGPNAEPNEDTIVSEGADDLPVHTPLPQQ